MAKFGGYIRIPRDGNECSRYLVLKPGNDETPDIWASGTFDRTAWHDAGALELPIAVDTSGQIYFQEKGRSADGAVLTWRARSARFQTGTGTTLFQTDTLIPDIEDFVGGAQVFYYTYQYPNGPETQHGPFDITDASGLRNVLVMVEYPTGEYDMIWDGQNLAERYRESTRINITNGFRFTVRRVGVVLIV